MMEDLQRVAGEQQQRDQRIRGNRQIPRVGTLAARRPRVWVARVGAVHWSPNTLAWHSITPPKLHPHHLIRTNNRHSNPMPRDMGARRLDDADDDNGPGSTAHNAQQTRDHALRAELEKVRGVNEAVQKVIDSLEKSRHNMNTVHDSVTSASILLDTWTKILSQTEHNQRMLLHPEWRGATVDMEETEHESILRQQAAERQAAEEEIRRAAAARAAEEEERRRTASKTVTRGTRSRGRAMVSSTRGSTTTTRGGISSSSTRGTTAASRAGSGIGRGISSTRSRGRGV